MFCRLAEKGESGFCSLSRLVLLCSGFQLSSPTLCFHIPCDAVERETIVGHIHLDMLHSNSTPGMTDMETVKSS